MLTFITEEHFKTQCFAKEISVLCVGRRYRRVDGNILKHTILEMVWAGRRLQDCLVPTSLPWAEVPEVLLGEEAAVTHHLCWC